MTKKLYPINNLGGGGFAGGEAAHKSPIHSFLLRRCQKPIYGGLEGGGTKFVCMVGRGPEDVIAEARIPTAAPGETIPPAIAFFEKFSEHGLTAIGLAPFGPLDLDRDSPTYGQISATPKQGWAHTDITGMFRKADIGLSGILDIEVVAHKCAVTPQDGALVA